MRIILATMVMAASVSSCGPAIDAEVDPRAMCEADVKEDLLNPETAEFFDFAPVDAGAFKAAVIPSIEADQYYVAGDALVEHEMRMIDMAQRLYRMRVRAEGKLGNTITSAAYCKQPSASMEMCDCRLIS